MKSQQNKQNITELTDTELLQKAQGGDPLAVDLLMRRHTRLVKSCTRPYFLAGADEEDLMQEGLLGLFGAIRGFDKTHGVPFSAFARVCIERALASAVRTAASLRQEPLNSSVSFDISQLNGLDIILAREEDPETSLIRTEAHRELLSRLTNELSIFEAKVLSLFLEGCSYEEMARKLGKPVKSVDNAIQRIRRKSASIFP